MGLNVAAKSTVTCTHTRKTEQPLELQLKHRWVHQWKRPKISLSRCQRDDDVGKDAQRPNLEDTEHCPGWRDWWTLTMEQTSCVRTAAQSPGTTGGSAGRSCSEPTCNSTHRAHVLGPHCHPMTAGARVTSDSRGWGACWAEAGSPCTQVWSTLQPSPGHQTWPSPSSEAHAAPGDALGP